MGIILSDRKLEKKAGTILGLPTFYQTLEELILAKLLELPTLFLKSKVEFPVISSTFRMVVGLFQKCYCIIYLSRTLDDESSFTFPKEPSVLFGDA